MESPCKYTAIYRCPDGISNFKIRVKFSEIDSPAGDSNNKWETRDFQWQSKAFSKAERELYGDEKNCVTDLEKKYHNDISSMPTAATESDGKLYSYTDEDGYRFGEIKENSLTRKMQEMSLGRSDEDEEADEESGDDENDVRKSILKSAKNPVVGGGHDVMYIMADLGEYVNTTWIKYEKALCTIKYQRKTKVLSIFPDFTTNRPYKFTVNGSVTKNYAYYIEHISKEIPVEDLLREKSLFQKITRRKVKDANFPLPPKNKLRVHLFLEILWAKQFEYAPIYVQYFIDLPKNWSSSHDNDIDAATSTNGMTQTCHVRDEEGVAHFGHVFDVTLDYNIEDLKGIPATPYIYFEVISRDKWSRYRTEGLTYKNLPVAKPGKYRYELQCFRLIANGHSGELKRFFIGDCSNYDDITWIGIPRDHDGAILNKYGTNTLGTGILSIRMNVIHQSQAFLDRFSENPHGVSGAAREIFDKLNSSSLVKSVEQVLQAFRRARKNMLEARKNV